MYKRRWKEVYGVSKFKIGFFQRQLIKKPLDSIFMPFDISILISKKEIDQKIQILADKINTVFEDSSDIVALCVLNGSYIFFSDLVRRIHKDMSCDFVSVSSYQKSKSLGKIKQMLNVQESLKDKQVLLIEDIVDTGFTMSYLQKYILSFKPLKLVTATLIKKITHPPDSNHSNLNLENHLSKNSTSPAPYHLDYIGFELKGGFLVGYGMDYHGLFRNLPYIGEIKNLDEIEK